jgi:translation initiation factor 1
MQRLFSGTKWDRPPTCDRCGQPEAECSCPSIVSEPVRLPPESQTARLRVEKRGKGKMVTLISNLDPDGNDLPALASTLKSECGVGGTAKAGQIELQGECPAAAEAALQRLGYKTRR